MISAYSSAVSGLNSASNSLAARADRILTGFAQPSVDEADADKLPAADGDVPFSSVVKSQRQDDLANDIAGLGLDETAYKANLAVLRSARDMQERLLDIIT